MMTPAHIGRILTADGWHVELLGDVVTASSESGMPHGLIRRAVIADGEIKHVDYRAARAMGPVQTVLSQPYHFADAMGLRAGLAQMTPRSIPITLPALVAR